MQRQSLGSPSSKPLKDELFSSETQKQYPSSSSSSPSSSTAGPRGLLYEEKEDKELKKPKTSMSESYIHLIPMLTLLCLLILYLSSHDPSQNDLVQFNGFRSSIPADSEDNMSELQRMVEIKKGDIVAIRSLKNLEQEAELGPRHRKMARV